MRIKQEIKFLNAAVLLLSRGYKVNGFVKVKSTYRDINAYYHYGLDIIVKKPALIMEPNIPKHLIVPTIKLKDGWVSQPIVKKIRLKKAVDILQKELNKYPNLFPDLHVHNVGWFKNKPLMYDW